MSHRFPGWLLAAAIASLVPAAGAAEPSAATASPTRPAKVDPLDGSAPVPPVAHRSALTGYRANRDAAVGSWRTANDEVARIGGWRAYAREAAQEAPAAQPPANAASAPRPKPAASGAGGGHRHH